MSSTSYTFENSRGRAIVTSDPTQANIYRNDPRFTEVTAGSADESPYEAMKVGELRDLVAERNAGRDPEGDTFIEVEAPGNKPQLVAALINDDNTPAPPPADA